MVIHKVLVIVGLILVLGVVVIVVLSCCPPSTQFLVMHLVLSWSLLPAVPSMLSLSS